MIEISSLLLHSVAGVERQEVTRHSETWFSLHYYSYTHCLDLAFYLWFHCWHKTYINNRAFLCVRAARILSIFFFFFFYRKCCWCRRWSIVEHGQCGYWPSWSFTSLRQWKSHRQAATINISNSPPSWTTRPGNTLRSLTCTPLGGQRRVRDPHGYYYGLKISVWNKVEQSNSKTVCRRFKN